jgi:hypothetical protein
MSYWWVNQNRTCKQEIAGGYLWSPKKKNNDHRNPFYESMREVAPGDIVFSFCDTRIAALGLVVGYCHESPKPEEFGNAGANWTQIGWRVEVRWQRIENSIRPKNHIESIRPNLPRRYSPLTRDGDGLQGIYLTQVNIEFASTLFNLIGEEANNIRNASNALKNKELNAESTVALDLAEWERREEEALNNNQVLLETERTALIQARQGQGKFRERVRTIEHACRITKVDRMAHLIASHVRPWRVCDNEARLDAENGLLLTPTIDHLFDKGFISFENNGDLIISPLADSQSLEYMGIDPNSRTNVGGFSEGQRAYLEYHRENILCMADRGAVNRNAGP